MRVLIAMLNDNVKFYYLSVLLRIFFFVILSFLPIWGCGGESDNSSSKIEVEITNIYIEDDPSGEVPISFTLSGPDSNSIDVETMISFDNNQSWIYATIIDSNTASLQSSPAGVEYTITWDCDSDIGIHIPASLTIKMTPNLNSKFGDAAFYSISKIDYLASKAYLNMRTAIDNLQHYIIYYGELNDEVISIAKTYQLVIIHSSNGYVTRHQVREIQNGVNPESTDDDVLVISYISVGEDVRTYGVTTDEMLADSRFAGDGTGPRIDPRDGAPYDDGADIPVDIDRYGSPSSGGSGFASFYLDDNDMDGVPDKNSEWGQCFVNAGDPLWFDIVNNMELDGLDGASGLKEILTLDYGRSLGCDGVFLDTIDTCAPNIYTNQDTVDNGGVRTEFEWTAPGFADFISTLRENYPKRIILQNRGLFFFTPGLPSHYRFSTRSDIDMLFYESYRLDNNPYISFNENTHLDNKHNIVPKIMAEAARSDGFKVISLGYAEGPDILYDTLFGLSDIGYDTLIEDLQISTQVGFRHYLTDRNLMIVNSFVQDHIYDIIDENDSTPPIWGSTYNDSYDLGQSWPGSLPTPRPGIQEAEFSEGSVIVRWDIAFDYNRVEYRLYYQEESFDFINDSDLLNAESVILSPEIGKDYGQGVHWQGSGPDIYPFQACIDGFESEKTYNLLIRAIDSEGNADNNEVFISLTIP